MAISGVSKRAQSSLTLQAARLVAAKCVAFGLSSALPVLLVRRLNIEAFALYKQVFLVLGSAMALAPLGFGMSALYFLPREHDPLRRAQVVFNVVLFVFATSGSLCAILFLRPGFLVLLVGEPRLASLSPFIGMAIMLWSVGSFLEIASLASGDAEWTAWFIVGSQITRTALLLTAGVAFGTVEALVYAAIVQGVLQTLVLLIYLHLRFGRFWAVFSWDMARAQLVYALPFGLAAATLQFQFDVPQYFVAHHFSAADYAIYAIGVFNLPLLPILAESAGSVMIPRVSELQSRGDVRAIVEATARMLRTLALVYFGVFSFLFVCGREFIVVIFTTQYARAWPVFAINLLLIPLALFTSGCDPILRAYSNYRYFFLKVRVSLVLMLVVILWLLDRRLTLTSLTAVVVTIAAIERLVTSLAVCAILGLSRTDLSLFCPIGKIAAAALVAGTVTLAVRAAVASAGLPAVLVAETLAFWFAYGIGTAFAGVLRIQDVDVLPYFRKQ